MRLRCCGKAISPLNETSRVVSKRIGRHIQWRGFAVTSKSALTGEKPRDIAVIGGGVTGLVTTYRLAENFPDVPIHLYEAGPRLGGWVQSKKVDVGQGGSVVFEQGPRNLRPSTPNGLITLHLVDKLGLTGELITTPKDSAAAKNRYIYYPDHLVRLPSSIWDALLNIREPLVQSILSGVATDLFTSPDQRAKPDDESVADFITRNFGPEVAQNIVSAVLHGIYAGDMHQLSAKSLLPGAYKMGKEHGSVVIGYLQAWLKDSAGNKTEDKDSSLMASLGLVKKDVLEKFNVENMSVFTFKGGLETLVRALVKNVRAQKNVHINTRSPSSIVMPAEADLQDVEVKTPSGTRKHSHAICTIAGPKLSEVLGPKAPCEPFTPSVTVMVVNIYYRTPNLLPVRGFGYLIPQSIPLEQNPERALGVVFDTEGSAGAMDTVDGTKLTVMLGGHWWDGWSEYPNKDQALSMAEAVLARHLGITEEPAAVNATLQKDCIPQYLVGHYRAILGMHMYIRSTWGDKVRLAGSSMGGVGLNDCVRSAVEAAEMLPYSSHLSVPLPD